MTRPRSLLLFTSAGLLALSASGTARGGPGGGGGAAPDGGAAVCVDDGLCVTPGENCTCKDCAPLALCHPGQCVDDGVCDLRDACTCKDCAADRYCSDPSRCKDDGVCDAFREGCGCADCHARPECSGFVASSTSSGTGGSGAGAALPVDDPASCALGAPSPARPALLALGVVAALATTRRRRR